MSTDQEPPASTPGGRPSERERLARIEELFHRAVDFGTPERAELLAPIERCDPELSAEVWRLLARADAGRDLSAAGPLLFVGVGAPTTEQDRPDPLLGTQLGAYRLVAPIGRGGMGSVYRAERADGVYSQTVAVKVIRTSLDAPGLPERFRVERQILARLEHPAIARLLDGGVAPDGRPFLVIEHVEGRPITEHADTARLTLDQRLALFQRVCGAVQHAHRNLVVHRDLKPANILVTAAGEVKLLDFGIAKLLAPDDAVGAGLTGTLAPLMTPECASPEQVRGEPVTTATDVYALGLLLYELLCGRRAQSPTAGSLAAIARTVCDEHPPAPSAALALGSSEEVERRLAARGAPRLERLQRRLRGDLDLIVARALRKDPAQRYPSAEQLAADVGRHLDRRPIVARPDTLRYRAGKLVRRHRLAVVATLVVALSLSGGLALALLGLVQAQRAERRALAEAAISAEVSQFLVDLFAVNDPGESKGDTVTARELLDRAAERIGTELAHQPRVQARLLATMAEAYEALGLFDPALELVARELSVVRAESGEDSAAAGRALARLADLYARKGDYPRSRDLALEAVAIHERHASEPGGAGDLSAALAQLGSAEARLGDLAAARPALERAVALIEDALGPSARELASPLNNLAILRWIEGDPAAARPLFRRALAITERDHGADSPAVANLLNNLALVHRQAGDSDAAVAAHRRALAIRQAVLAPDHPDIAESLNNLGSVMLARGEHAAARDLCARALAIRERVLGPDHDHVAATLNNLGSALLGLGDLDAAGPLLERSLHLLERAVGTEHVLVSHPLLGLAHIAAANGDGAAAERLFRRAVGIREARLGDGHPDLAAARAAWAEFRRARGLPPATARPAAAGAL